MADCSNAEEVISPQAKTQLAHENNAWVRYVENPRNAGKYVHNQSAKFKEIVIECVRRSLFYVNVYNKEKENSRAEMVYKLSKGWGMSGKKKNKWNDRKNK